MYTLICTTFNSTASGLTLRSNWTERVVNNEHLLELVEKWNLPTDFKYPSKNSISNILEGTTDMKGVVIHVRIVKF